MSPTHPPSETDRQPDFDRAASFRAIGFSLIVNALCPFLLFRHLEPRFPPESVLPLLYVTIFPIAGFLFGVLRKRMVDAIAVIALAGIAIQLIFTILSPDVGTALVLRSFRGAIVGACFLASAAIRRPIILYVARQLVGAKGPAWRAGFDAAVAQDRAHAFLVTTTIWGAALMVLSGVHVVLALELPHDDFVLVSPIVGVVADLALLAWTMRYMMRRMSAYRHAPGPSET